jgi:hydroxymethylpyrimidine pyrophosphatase-like HAD family hydrolase
VLGHVQRGGTPTARDRVLATRYGLKAAELVHERRFGRMAALHGDAIVDVSLAEATAELKTVPPEWYDVAARSSADRVSHAPTATRLAAIDLDGTLLRSDTTISDRSRTALADARAAGIVVVLVTARSPRSVRVIARDAGLDGLAICATARRSTTSTAGTIVRHTDARRGDRAPDRARSPRAHPGIAFGWELELRFGSEPAYEAQRDAAWWPRPDDAYPACDVLEWHEPMTKLLARLPGVDLDDVLAHARELGADEASVTLTGDAFVEVMAAGVAKEAALAALAAERGIAPGEVGRVRRPADRRRDARMGRASESPSRTPIPARSRRPTRVTVSNDEDGVALVLERLASLSRGAARPSARSRR